MLKPVTFTAFAGVRNTLQPERLHVMPTKDDGSTDLVEAVNVDIDNGGQVARRAGSQVKNAGAAHSLFARGDVALFARGTSLNRLNADFSATALAALTVTQPLSYVAVNDRIYWANGTDSGVVQDGRARSWGIVIPAAPGLSLIAGNLSAGQYQAVVTTVRADGQESGAGMPSTFTLNNDGGLRVTWAAPTDPDIQSVRVYVSEPNGEILYRAAEVPAGQLQTDVTNAAGALPLNTQWNDKPPAGQALAYANGRIFIADGAFIFATTALGFEYVDLRDYLSLDGTRVRLLAGVEGGLFAATDVAAYFLSGKTLEEMVLTKVSDRGGLAGSVAYVDGERATGIKEMAGKRCALFTTGEGVLLGLPDGTVMNLTQQRYRFDIGTAGAAVFHDTDTLNSYLLFLQP